MRPSRALVGGLAVPLHGQCRVLPDALAFGVANAEEELRRSKSLVGGLAEPLHGLCRVLPDADAVVVAIAEEELGLSIA